MKEITSADLSIIEKAIREMWPALGDLEVRKELAEGIVHLAKNGTDERTRTRATMIASNMVAQGIKLGLAGIQEQKQTGPTVHIGNLSVSLDPGAFLAFQEDVRQATTPKPIQGEVIDHEPLPNGLKELPGPKITSQTAPVAVDPEISPPSAPADPQSLPSQ